MAIAIHVNNDLNRVLFTHHTWYVLRSIYVFTVGFDHCVPPAMAYFCIFQNHFVEAGWAKSYTDLPHAHRTRLPVPRGVANETY